MNIPISAPLLETSEVHDRSLPPASVIIVSRNRASMLKDTLHSLLSSDDVPTEIIIVDQSDQQNAELASLPRERECEIRYLWTRPEGASRARNLGIQRARHELLAFADDDLFFAPNWYASLIRTLADSGDRVVVTGRVLPAENGDGFAPSLKGDDLPEVYAGRVGRDVLYSGNMAIYKSTIEAVGSFDERLGPGTRFPSAEDNDLGFRLLEAGNQIRYSPDAIVYHRAWRTSGAYLGLRRSYGIGRGAFYAKYFSASDSYMLRRMLDDLRNHLVHSVSRMRLDRQAALGDLMLAVGIAVGAGQWLLLHKREKTRARAPLS